ncbi:hypothetical protein MO767_27665 [Pseudomonas sp. UYIF39]|uniref:hypothetical protein n=1 Tax=Pseudomonas sp. UYIF39 TaxID=1630747 RepID=UPI00249F887D|nr:hypothetical protein [Pseudomonas sp. UYIF39]MDI3358092.1 hypothetical protein [Pseudomonas sp. UYIF39]
MTNKTPFPTANHKDHFIYDNQPFINPEHGELHPIEWAFVIDTNLIPPSDEDYDDFIIPPEYYLQITASGEIRGVTHEYDEHEEYFSVTAGDSDVRLLKAFSTQYPNITPTLSDLLDYRKYCTTKWKEQLNQEKENTSNDD